MKLHREGHIFLLVSLLIMASLNVLVYFLLRQYEVIFYAFIILSVVFYSLLVQFFRNPTRNTTLHEQHIIAPADGKVVVIEETVEGEYFKDKRIQISVFMSPLNVHVNRNPISGIFRYVKYHKGKYLVAWHPKSSTENERTTLVIEHSSGKSILMRQIAGALAKRIKWYVQDGDKATQGQEFGFIKFGSRVDLFVPLNTKINVQIDDRVKGGETVLATFTS